MCMGGYFGGGYPDPGGYIIAELKKGDIISLEAGAGHPSAETKRDLTIYEVHQFAALCTDGTLLSCHDGNRLTKTGKTDPRPKPSMKARKILANIWWRNLTESISDTYRDIDAKIWLFMYRIRNRRKSNKK